MAVGSSTISGEELGTNNTTNNEKPYFVDADNPIIQKRVEQVGYAYPRAMSLTSGLLSFTLNSILHPVSLELGNQYLGTSLQCSEKGQSYSVGLEVIVYEFLSLICNFQLNSLSSIFQSYR
jgi:hypothetical protein